jgi:hypothetical protein
MRDTIVMPTFVQTNTYRTLTDPLIHHGRHFGRVVHTFCNIRALITNGLTRMTDPPEEESLRLVISGLRGQLLIAQCSEYQEYLAFMDLLRLCPNLEDRIAESSEAEVEMISDFVSSGRFANKADSIVDTKRHQWGSCRRHKGDEKCHYRLDNSVWTIAYPSACPPNQIYPWFQPREDGCVAVSSWIRLDVSIVSPRFL